MASLREQLKAHEARAKRARTNIEKLRRALSHNRAILKAEQIRAARVKKKLAGVGERKRAVRWALDAVGTVESPPFSNKGPRITKWQEMSGYPGGGVPWCQCFANVSAWFGMKARTELDCGNIGGYTVSVVDRAKRLSPIGGVTGWKSCRLSECQPGDWVYFKFSPGGDSVQHVGVFLEYNRAAGTVKCVEGNTSPGNGGSQDNGGGAFIRTRPTSVVAACVKVPFKS